MRLIRFTWESEAAEAKRWTFARCFMRSFDADTLWFKYGTCRVAAVVSVQTCPNMEAGRRYFLDKS